jgi:uncharacterized protein (DUF4415 family)
MSTLSAGDQPTATRHHDRGLRVEEIARLPDSEIDLSDIPELGEAFWAKARIVSPEGTEQITLRLPRHVLRHFKQCGKGYQSRISAVLSSYVDAATRTTG